MNGKTMVLTAILVICIWIIGLQLNEVQQQPAKKYCYSLTSTISKIITEKNRIT